MDRKTASTTIRRKEPAFAIRRLSAEADTLLYREVRLEALSASPEAFVSDLSLEAGYPLDWFSQSLTTSAVFGAFDHEGLAGFAGVGRYPSPKQAHKALLWNVYVRPRARRRGIARALVAAVIADAAAWAERLQLGVTGTNRPARRLYASMGFRKYGIQTEALKIGGHYFDEVMMTLDLRARG